MSTKRIGKNPDRVISLRIPVALNLKAEKAAKTTHLRKSDVLRMAVDRGIDLLLEQLTTETAKAS